MSDAAVDEGGSGLVLACVALALAAVVVLLVLDLTSYLVAFARAQTAADAAALAAVGATDEGRADPRDVAAEIAQANGAELLGCDCRPGAERVTVRVSIDVRTIAVARLGDRRVEATATARLVRDTPMDLGPDAPTVSP